MMALLLKPEWRFNERKVNRRGASTWKRTTPETAKRPATGTEILETLWAFAGKGGWGGKVDYAGNFP